MKLTQTGQTLFQALSLMLVDSLGRRKPKAQLCEHATIVPRFEGETLNALEVFAYGRMICRISGTVNQAFVDVSGVHNRFMQYRLNKIFNQIGLKVDSKKGWALVDAAGQKTPFRDGAIIDLTRPHGSAIYNEQAG